MFLFVVFICCWLYSGFCVVSEPFFREVFKRDLAWQLIFFPVDLIHYGREGFFCLLLICTYGFPVTLPRLVTVDDYILVVAFKD